MPDGVVLVDTTAYAPLTPLFGSALQRFAATTGRPCALVDEGEHLGSLSSRLAFHAGPLCSPLLRDRRLNRFLIETCERLRPAAVIVVKGAYVTHDTVEALRRLGALTVNYSTDDPFNRAAGPHTLRSAIGAYDIVFTPRLAVVDDLRAAGCRRVEHLPFAYNPDVHFPEHPSEEERQRYACDLALIGGADSGRVRFVEELLRVAPELSLKLYGGYWRKHGKLRRFAAGTVMGREYRLAVAGATASLNLVRRANRDGHVMRSFELPACRALVLAERTTEHERLFGDGRDLFLFDSVEELAALVTRLSRDPDERERVAEHGYNSVTGAPNTYADRFASILEACGLAP